MERSIVIARVMEKLSNNRIDIFVKIIENLYKRHKKTKFDDDSFPKELLLNFGEFMDRERPTQKDKLEILKEFKKRKLFNFELNKNLEKAWRLILKKWDLSSYRLEGGI